MATESETVAATTPTATYEKFLIQISVFKQLNHNHYVEHYFFENHNRDPYEYTSMADARQAMKVLRRLFARTGTSVQLRILQVVGHG